MSYSNGELRKMYEKLVLARKYEEKIMNLVSQGKIGAFYHLAMGQEAVGVGIAHALGNNDYLQPTFRSHPALVSLLDLKKMTAELLGRTTGYNGGKASTIHICSKEDHVLPSNGILGTSVPLAAGFALALKQNKKAGVVVAVIGDGAFAEGNVYEGLNIIALLKLPVVVFIENNQWAVSNPVSSHASVADLASRASAYGLTGVTIDGNDVVKVRETLEAAIAKAREGEPNLVEAKTYRWRGHFEGDPCAYRDPQEFAEAKKGDPLPKMAKTLLEKGILLEKDLGEIDRAMQQKVDEAFDYALSCPIPTKEQTLDLNMVYASNLGGDLA